MKAILLVFLIAVAVHAQLDDNYSFEDYVTEFHKTYSVQEYAMRKAIFDTKAAAIRRHNRDNTKTWKEGVNKYTDATEQEFKSLLGYNKALRNAVDIRNKVPYLKSSLPFALPDTVDWRLKNVVTEVKDQLECGSCWTFATAEVLESHWALATGNLTVLSEQQILDCTPNPQHCGGTGGCGGGIAELAYDRIKVLGGLTSEKLYPYVSGGGRDFQCKNPIPPPVAKVSGYTKLPENEYEALLEAVATKGPIAISVDASSWSNYRSGVYDGCSLKQPDIDHAVVLVGYGTDAKLGDYWLVRNSWSALWGEKGYIRLKRSASPACGVDTTPNDGDACTGGPANVTVCGTCGMLSDSCYPIVAAH